QQAAPRVDLVDAELIAVAVLGAGYVELAGQGERGCEHDRLAVALSTGSRVGGGGRVGATGRGARGSRGVGATRCRFSAARVPAGRQHHADDCQEGNPPESSHRSLLTLVSSF